MVRFPASASVLPGGVYVGEARLGRPAAALCADPAEVGLLLLSPPAGLTAEAEGSCGFPVSAGAVSTGERSVAVSAPATAAAISCAAEGVAVFDPDAGTLGGPTMVLDGVELLSWGCYNTGYSGYTRVTMTAETSDLCSLRFIMYQVGAARKTISTNASSPDQTSPHSVWVDVVDPSYLGKWYDLYWNYTVGGGEGSGNLLVGYSAVYLPLFPETPFEV